MLSAIYHDANVTEEAWKNKPYKEEEVDLTINCNINAEKKTTWKQTIIGKDDNQSCFSKNRWKMQSILSAFSPFSGFSFSKIKITKQKTQQKENPLKYILEIIEQVNKKINEINNSQESEEFNTFTLMLDPKRIILRR
ncbi:unnamed protein product [Acanthoscelides obtectus]|uniref:Uncharacterized protein n=1 Tax=Acanthoscelides obtectus TaxID=200917 RepID=A0A9P0Q6W8_ACAOB|nr:unnamed protein product [Acanthoscelides obtectus]CAK1625112.1 hypothetical protein AOBTE_LOCUS2962 [Acanthoscelides obtectus]